MKGLIYTIILALIFSFIVGCKAKTVYVPVESNKVEKEYIDRWLKDSVYIQDSIFFAIKGDTIFLEKYKYVYKDKVVRDPSQKIFLKGWMNRLNDYKFEK